MLNNKKLTLFHVCLVRWELTWARSNISNWTSGKMPRWDTEDQYVGTDLYISLAICLSYFYGCVRVYCFCSNFYFHLVVLLSRRKNSPNFLFNKTLSTRPPHTPPPVTQSTGLYRCLIDFFLFSWLIDWPMTMVCPVARCPAWRRWATWTPGCATSGGFRPPTAGWTGPRPRSSLSSTSSPSTPGRSSSTQRDRHTPQVSVYKYNKQFLFKNSKQVPIER